MAETLTETGSSYHPAVGFVFVFNLIVGTGALTMPMAFGQAGLFTSVVCVTILAFMSYMTATFVIEAMATANAIRRYERRKGSITNNKDSPMEVDEIEASHESRPLLSNQHGIIQYSNNELDATELYDITERFEMGQMASIFFNKWGRNLFYFGISLYLYGDLAIYAAAVPQSLRDVVCSYQLPPVNGSNATCNPNITDSDPCWPESISRANAYRVFLTAFIILLGSFVFFNVQKTKYLQLVTTFLRWLAFIMMITLAVIRLAQGKGEGHPPMWGRLSGVPELFGVCVYSFMCHHSLPSLVTPISKKKHIYSLFAADYSLILVFYFVLSITGIFSFSELNSLYTLNFQPVKCTEGTDPITNIAFIQYFLALFPVFTLSTNFPIIGITLRNNLKALVLHEDREYNWVIVRFGFPLATLLPPLAIAMATSNVAFLMSITGAFAGAGIQYFVPAGLISTSRKQKCELFGMQSINKYQSPFRHPAWVILVLVWAVLCVIFVLIYHIMRWAEGNFP